LWGVSRRKAPRTTQRKPAVDPVPDLVQRHFTAEAPDRLWMADLTSLRPGQVGYTWLSS
jgi:transposase InsO family protein